ncbi:Fur-regulated basic protein FbpA [Bacillus salipaludis]|uniref:Fur-regulated basic protein FbpA n=1 Tax=Bacillus salipaludis TaxID=2547811 RepID=UPI002E1E2789|nr:Fur-regulated basic protein FbpA [Bacillus salipaludis]
MGDVFLKAVENRRKILIEKLIAFNVYKKDHEYLFKLTLTELENEYRKFLMLNHPHSGFESIKWINKES